ncbi:MAG: CcmD family protein [Thalassobius sp.]|nr:CcmD family protein [Thalassovita sp.]
MYKFIKILLLSFALSFSFAETSMAQEKQKITEQDYANNEIEMADTMRSNGKIYIVVATIISLFAGIVVYLVMLDKKIGALEKNILDDSI